MTEQFVVYGGELAEVSGVDFRDPDNVHVVGVFSSYAAAKDAWRSNAQRTVDNAHMRYFLSPAQTAPLQVLALAGG